MKKTIGVLDHVDAGKTTFSEQLLYHTKSIRSRGRVDHKDAFLDSHTSWRFICSYRNFKGCSW